MTLKKTEYEYNSIGWLLTQRVFTLQGTQRNQSAGQAINYTLSQATNYETHYTYNKRGQIKTTIDPKGFVTQLSYDTKGRLSQVRDALLNTMTYTYDGRDLVTKKRITSATNGTTYDTRYFYDHDARLVKTMNNDGKYKSFVYNDLNQIVRIRDENGRRTDMTYDYQGNVLSQTQYLITSG